MPMTPPVALHPHRRVTTAAGPQPHAVLVELDPRVEPDVRLTRLAVPQDDEPRDRYPFGQHRVVADRGHKGGIRGDSQAARACSSRDMGGAS